MATPPTLAYDGERVKLLDQSTLPGEVRFAEITTVESMAHAIKTLQVRGAPAIGAAAAFGMVLAAKAAKASTTAQLLDSLAQAKTLLASTRPTAVNLFWALDEMLKQVDESASVRENLLRLEARAVMLLQEDIEINKRLGRNGAALFEEPAVIYTHCNAGALATCGYGTALGVVRALHEQGKLVRVYADETRPVLQGARLTAWELLQDGIPCTLVCDTMAAHVMATREVTAVVVGADRIAANGDVANKIGTYQLALVAQAHQVPFYVAAPLSTFDLSLPEGRAIPIEERSPEEVTHFAGVQTAPADVEVFNPAFDVTHAALITGLINEAGVVLKPDTEKVAALFEAKGGK